MEGADMLESCPYTSFAEIGVVALAYPPWINGGTIAEDCPYTSFGIVLAMLMLSELSSCVMEYEIVHIISKILKYKKEDIYFSHTPYHQFLGSMSSSLFCLELFGSCPRVGNMNSNKEK